jgi:hypothetical protein
METYNQRVYFNESRKKDPEAWLEHANGFHQIYDFTDEKLPNDAIRNDKFNCICIAMPQVVAISAELYMKGFLLCLGVPLQEVINLGHNLVQLRDKCFEASKDDRFNDREIRHFIDGESRFINEKGGIKYPRSHIFPSGSHFNISLDILENILEEKINETKHPTT